MKSYVKAGATVDWTNGTGSAVASGDVVVVGFNQVGIASVAIANGAVGSVAVSGVFRVDKYATSNAFLQGGGVWWNPATGLAYNVPATTYLFMGYADKAASATGATVDVKLAPFACEGVRIVTLAATGNQAVVAADFYGGDLLVSAPNTAAHELALPAVATVPIGAKITVYKTTADAEIVTINPASAELIDGGATFTGIDAQYDRATFVNSGTAWVKVDYALA